MGHGVPLRNDSETIWNRLHDAKLRADLVHAYMVEIQRDTASGLLPEPDELYESALKSERIAVERYLDAVTQLTAHRTPAIPTGGDEFPGPAGENLLESVLKMAIESTGADMGNIQIVDVGEEALKIRAHCGFKRPFLDFFASVRDESSASCGVALKAAQRVIVNDVSKSGIFAGTTALEVLLDAGVQACQSTPLITPTGKLVGMLSTHYHEPTMPTKRDLAVIDQFAAQTAALL